MDSGEKHRRLKEMEAKQIEKQRPVVNLVSPIAQATEMARSEIKKKKNVRWQKVRPLYLQDSIKSSTDRSRMTTFNTKVPLYE